MFQFRQVLVRLRAGDTAREVARSGLLGRDKVNELMRVAQVRISANVTDHFGHRDRRR